VEQPARGLGERAGQFARQAFVLTRRYFALWRRDTSSLLAMAGQSLVVALLLAVVFGDVGGMPTDPSTEEKDITQALARAGKPPPDKPEANKAEREKAARTVNLLFLLAVSSFWFGCNNAAKEIVKERTIFVRECDFNLMPSGYYLSKLVVLCGFSFLQVLLLYGVTTAACHPPGNVAGQLALLLTLAAAGTTLGLFISTLAPTEEVAITLIPMVIIPQIILSGTIAPLSGVGKLLAAVGVTTYWGKQGLDALLPEAIGDAARASKIAEDGSFALALAVLAAHTLAFMAATLVVMTLRGRSAAMKLHQLRKAITRG
jgi:ABC transport system ATP-binding/permease protein